MFSGRKVNLKKGSDKSPVWLTFLLLGLFPVLLALDDPSARESRTRLEAMSPEQLDQLLRKKQSFDLLTPSERDRLRRLDHEIHAQSNHEQLMQTLRGYHEWLATLPSSEQARIMDRPAAERIADMKDMISQQRQRELGVTDETRLPPEDFDALSRWARELGERKRDEIARIFASLDERALGGSRRGNQSFLTRLMFVALRGGIPEERLSQLVSDEELEQLADALSPKGAQILAEQSTKQDKLRLVRNWLTALAVPRVSDADLRAFFADGLNDDDREEIVRLGPVEGRQRLMQLYRESRFRRGFFRPADAGPPNENPGSPRPPPPRPPPGSDETVDKSN
jgi:hypothetical protein